MVGKGFVPIERTREILESGRSEIDVIDILREEGFSAPEIDKALTQVVPEVEAKRANSTRTNEEILSPLVHFSEDDKIEGWWHAMCYPNVQVGDIIFTREKLLFLSHPKKGTVFKKTLHDHYDAVVLEVPYDDIKAYQLGEYVRDEKQRKIIRTDMGMGDYSDISSFLFVVCNDDAKNKHSFHSYHLCSIDHGNDRDYWYCDIAFDLGDYYKYGKKCAANASSLGGKLLNMYKERKAKEDKKLEVTQYEIKYDVAKLVESKLFEFGEDGGLLTHCPYCKEKNPHVGKERVVECSACGEKYIAPKKILEMI